MRLQKFLANAGIGSRRKCEEYIARGRVEVNGKTVQEQGYLIDPLRDTVKYLSKEVHIPSDYIYLMLNKPAGCISTCNDEFGRPTVMKYLKGINKRVYPVGRLDFNSEGLLLFTNDGKLANKLTHPKHNVQKKYLAVADCKITDDDIRKLSNGVIIDNNYRTSPGVFKLLNTSERRSEIICIISEGKNRQIRKMFDVINKNIIYLKRIAVGDIKLGNLKKGAFRELTKDEIKLLKTL